MCDTLQSIFPQIRLGRLGLRIHKQESSFAFIIPELSSKSTHKIIIFEHFMFLLRQGFICMILGNPTNQRMNQFETSSLSFDSH